MASAMKQLSSHDHAVHWLNVKYNLNQIHDGWSLTLTQSKSGDGQDEAVVDCGIATPRIAVRVLDLNGGTVGVGDSFVDSQLPQDGQTRAAFLLGHTNADVRCWGQIKITVDDKSYRVLVPSSLFKYKHGHAASD